MAMLSAENGTSEVESALRLADVRESLSSGDPTTALRLLAGAVEDGPLNETTDRIEHCAALLEEYPEVGRRLGSALADLLMGFRIGPALVESGVASSDTFISELWARITRRFLPELDEEGDLRTAIRHFFPGKDARERINGVPDTVWIRLLEALDVDNGSVRSVHPEVASAIRTLAHHAGSLGLKPVFTSRLPHLENPDSPFLELTETVLAYLRSCTTESVDERPQLAADSIDTIRRCRAEVEELRRSKDKHGTSLELTGTSLRLLQLLDRLEILLDMIGADRDSFQQNAVTLFREIVVAEKTRNSVLSHLRQRADLLAFQVVEHAARKGGRYITSDRSDYTSFFLASAGGGAIVAVFSFIKVILSSQSLPLGIEALVFGLNYSACFVLIYLTGAALATKQPALTANTIARALGNKADRHLEDLEVLVVRVWRSQFVSFVGNLSLALPAAFLISEVFFRTTGQTVASPDKAAAMLADLHLWESGTLAFAALAGVFLYVAGLVAGWVDNRNIYSRLSERVARHPMIVRIAGASRAAAAGRFIDKNLGVLAGNVFLGFALGSTGTLGKILGLPVDIRHVAFASAEFGTALEILHFDVAFKLVLPVALGVVLTGLVNFLVSFGLSLATAMESRQITWREIGTLMSHLKRRFLRSPLEWFFPTKKAGAR